MESELGPGLERLRMAAGFSRARLGARAGVSYAFIQQLETGTRKMARGEVLAKLAKALGVTTDELLAGATVEAGARQAPEQAQSRREALLEDIAHACQSMDTPTLETVRTVIAGFSKLDIQTGRDQVPAE